MSRTRALPVVLTGVVAISAAAPGTVPAQTGTWALINARIHTVTGGVIERGTIIVRNGLIDAVGAAVPVPPDARVLDLAGKTVSPGITDLASTLGAPAAAAGAQRGPGQPAPPASAPGRPEGLNPAFSVVDDLKLSLTDLKAARDAGITAVLVAANRGALRGSSALVPTRDSAGRAEVLRSPAAMHFGFQGAQGQYPATLLGVITYTRQTLYDAQRYALLAERYRTDPRGITRPDFDPGLEALVPAIRRDLPVFFAAANENEIRRATRIAQEFNLDLVLVGATEGWRALDALAGRAAVVSVNFPKAPDVTGWTYHLTATRPMDSAAADAAARPEIEGNAAALERSGVRFALGSGGTRPADFLANVRKAIAAGLPAEAALAALTIRPAELVGLGRALGSIEPGKIANLVVTERGDLLADSARVRAVFVDGIHYPVEPAPAGRRTAAGAGALAEIGGTWLMTISSPQGPMDVTMTVSQSGGSFTGTMSSMMGGAAIDEGQISGRSVTWSMTMQMGGTSITIAYRGEVDGNRMTGSASLGQFGTASFTAERRP